MTIRPDANSTPWSISSVPTKGRRSGLPGRLRTGCLVNELTAIANASQARLYQATNPLTIRAVFQQVISNF